MTPPARPAPLTDADADLTMFKDMPFEVVRFAKSDLVAFASAEAILAALMLWGSAWHSRPAGSLTNDDRALMRAAGFGRGADAAWQEVKDDALRGWIECSDGRLYHPVVAEKVAASWRNRLKQRHANYCTAIRMHNSRNPEDQRDRVTFDQWTAMGRPEDVRDTAPKPIQEEMTLDGDEMLRRTADPVTSNTDHSSGAQAPQGKGGEGRGVEGTYLNDVATPAEERKSTIDPFDVVKTADALARRAGVPHTAPSVVADNIGTVRQWRGDGIDLAIVEAEIDRFRLDKPDQRVSRLSFFDQSVRAKVAAQEAKSRNGTKHKPAITGAPIARLGKGDADDDRVRTIRAKVGKGGDLSHDKAAISIDADTLVVTARSSFVAAKLKSDHWNALHASAQAVGLVDVEVRVQ